MSEGQRDEAVALTSAVCQDVGFQEHRAMDVAGRAKAIMAIAGYDLETGRVDLVTEDPVFAATGSKGLHAAAGDATVPHRLIDPVAGDLPTGVAEGFECEEYGMGKCFGGTGAAWFDGCFWRV